MNNLSGKVVLVTGSMSGIGLATGKLCIKSGAEAVIFTRHHQSIDLQEIDDHQGLFDVIHLDVCDENSWEQARQFIEQKYGRLDILIHNAGITGTEEDISALDLETTTLESWQKVHATNLDAVFIGTKKLLGLLKASGNAAVVIVASRSGIIGRNDRMAYASGKAALINLTKSLAIDFAVKGYSIRCNAVVPSTIRTPVWDFAMRTPEGNMLISKIEERIPLRRFGTPEEVAKAIVFLASDNATYINGTKLIVDGGASASDDLRN